MHILRAALWLTASLLPAPLSLRVADLPMATPETYRTSAGTRVGDTVVVSLEMRTAQWRPQGNRAIAVPVYVFAEPGKEARVPGPMVRVTEGGVVRLTLRNTLTTRVVVRGLQPRPFGDAETDIDSVAVLPGRDTTITFAAGVAGSYFYWGRTTPTKNHRIAPIPGWMWGGEAEEGPFVGALIVDAKGTRPDPHERTFLITRWLDEYTPRINDTVDWKVMVNGASYPNTEPLTYTVGDTVRWRVINATLASHPMHLHGFYFRVLAHDVLNAQHPVERAVRRDVVTELLDVGESMHIEWIPERPGNWLFHCHLTRHMTGWQNLPSDTVSAAAAAHRGHEGHEMAGLVLGITVRAKPGTTARAQERLAAGANATKSNERAIRLFAQTRPGVFGANAGYAFVAQAGAKAPALDSVTQPSSLLLLKRGEPVRITVVNRIAVPLSVHWHGMELESWYDGVGGFSGMGAAMRAPITPRDSFVVRFTPPRSGTFMFHTHDESGSELASGLYGALLVLDNPSTYDPRTDHVMLLATRGPGDSAIVAVNGRDAPPPLRLQAGVTQRVRFASISSNEKISVSLVKLGEKGAADATVQQWSVRAVDGADIVPSQRGLVPARRTMSAGMTMDVEFVMPSTEGYALRVRMSPYEAFEFPGSTALVRLIPTP
jgi:FtsP/CotA-like multicopper oxidase with cupredoxin domain